MNSLEAFLAIVIICIDHNERSLNNLLRCKHGLTSSPRLCTAYWKFSRNIVDVLKSVIHGHVMGSIDCYNSVANDLFELFLDILTDNKYHMIEASLNRIMD